MKVFKEACWSEHGTCCQCGTSTTGLYHVTVEHRGIYYHYCVSCGEPYRALEALAR